MDPEAARLRASADELRRLASAIEASPVMELDRYAGEDTVTGPRFDELLIRLRRCQHDLFAQAEELRWTAHRWHLQADELDAAALRAAALTPIRIV